MSILRKERLKRRMTLSEVGRVLGTDATNVLRYERGTQRPAVGRAVSLARLLGLSLEQVYGVERQLAKRRVHD